jgi:hypothetical protein
MPDTNNATYQRLEDQIAWYGDKSDFNHRRFKLIKGTQLLAAARSRSSPRSISMRSLRRTPYGSGGADARRRPAGRLGTPCHRSAAA